MKRYLSSLALILLLAGCGKDEPLPPIIEPGPWYPVYPGSWWKYQVNDSSIITDYTSPDYKVDYYLLYEDPDRYSEPARVPFLNGAPIYRYSYVEVVGYPENYYGNHKLWPILSDQVGDSFNAYWVDQRYGDPVEVMRVKSKTFNGKDSLLMLVGTLETWNAPNHVISAEVRTRIYTRDIGLSSEFLVDTSSYDTLFKKVLIDHFVNHSI